MLLLNLKNPFNKQIFEELKKKKLPTNEINKINRMKKNEKE